jgi:putative alpha-1,2-mannosidase
MLFPLLIRESAVGGERIVMSMAVDLRMGTSGVSSTAIKGGFPSGSMISSPSARKAFECAAFSSNACTFPGVMTMLHSSGCRLSQ